MAWENTPRRGAVGGGGGGCGGGGYVRSVGPVETESGKRSLSLGLMPRKDKEHVSQRVNKSAKHLPSAVRAENEPEKKMSARKAENLSVKAVGTPQYSHFCPFL